MANRPQAGQKKAGQKNDGAKTLRDWSDMSAIAQTVHADWRKLTNHGYPGVQRPDPDFN